MAEWTTEKPTTFGLFWAYENLEPQDADVMLIEIITSYFPEEHLIAIYGNEQTFELDHFSHFMKLEPPAPPG